MSIIRGLKDIEAILDKPKFESNGPKVRWLKLEDGQSVKVRFANEVSADSPHYEEGRGLAIVVQEHQNPKDFKRSAICTQEDQGRCFACEMAQREPKSGWRGRFKFYTNVIVDDGMEDPYVAVWKMGVAKASTFNTIREYVSDSGSLSNVTWRLKRNGKGTETNYVLIPTKEDSEAFNWSPFELTNLEHVVRDIPYAEQESFYLGLETSPATSANADW